MPRGPEPSWEMKKTIIDLAAKQGQENLTVIQRDLDRLVGEGKPLQGESTPDFRTIKRVIKQFQTLDPQIVVREFPPYVWKIRADFNEIRALAESEKPGKEAREQFLPLLQRWREQVFFLSLDQLLRIFGREAQQVELLRHNTDSQRALEIYAAAKGHHVQGIPGLGKVLPQVTEEGLFQRLRQRYRDDPIWEAQDSWGLAHGAYLEAFGRFFAEVQGKFEVFSAAACMNYLRGRGLQMDVGSVLDILDELKKEHVHLSIVLRLAGVMVSCDLLTLGMEQLAANPLWCLEVDKLETVRAEAVNYITELPEPSPVALDHVGTAAKLLWEHEPEIRQKTLDLLDKLQGLQAADDDLQSKLRALEWRLYGVAESQSP